MIIDLHLHSHFSSDGAVGIEDILAFFSCGDIVALTDHETIAGWSEFRKKARQKGVIPIFGVEWFSKGCHILSYFLQPPNEIFFSFMQNRRELEGQCMKLVFEKMRLMNRNLPDYKVVLKYNSHPENILGLPALAEAWVKCTGASQTEAEDLVRSLKRQMPEGVRPQTFYPEEIIQKTIAWGGVPVLAHPFRNSGGLPGRKNKEDVEKLIWGLFLSGLKGIEIISADSDFTETNYLLELCERYDLLSTVGSDFHSETVGKNPTALADVESRLKERMENWLMGERIL
jgi:predicted metal-dependent phosphoesterase TrpH